MVIAGAAGIGKTYFAKKYTNVIDLETSEFAYDYTKVSQADHERLKGDNTRERNPEFPDNYIRAIKDGITKYDYVLVACHPQKILPHLEKHKIDYICIIPSEDAAQDYYQKYIDRGNSPEWAKKVANHYISDYWIKSMPAFNRPIIHLQKGENLEDYLLSHQDKYPHLV
ncbi:MAG: ATP-binding protein [Christensenellaceae bacterium]|jgi:hypothetical protein|nr:ATP-binding protein [Christensenellaceae bacterium]